MDPKFCEKENYTYKSGLWLVCDMVECENNDDGICKEFKPEK